MSAVEYCVALDETGFSFSRRLASNFWEVLLRGNERYEGWLSDIRGLVGASGLTPVQVRIPIDYVKTTWLEDLGPSFTQLDYAQKCAEAVNADLGKVQIDIVRSRNGDILCLAAGLQDLMLLTEEFERSGFTPRLFVVVLNGEAAERDACFFPTVPGVVPAVLKVGCAHMRTIDAPKVIELTRPVPEPSWEEPSQTIEPEYSSSVPEADIDDQSREPDDVQAEPPVPEFAVATPRSLPPPCTEPSVNSPVSGRPAILISSIEDVEVGHRAFQLTLLSLGMKRTPDLVHVLDRCDKLGRSALTSAIGYGLDHGASDDLLLSKREGNLSAGLKRYDSCAADILGQNSVVFISPTEAERLLHWADRRNAKAICSKLRLPPLVYVLTCTARLEDIRELQKRFAHFSEQPRFPVFVPHAFIFDRNADHCDDQVLAEIDWLVQSGVRVSRVPYLKTDIVSTAYTSGISIERLLAMEFDDVASTLSISEWEAHSGMIELGDWIERCMSAIFSDSSFLNTGGNLVSSTSAV